MSGAFRKAGPKREIDDRRACPDHGVEGGRYRATGAALALGRPDKAWTRPGQGLGGTGPAAWLARLAKRRAAEVSIAIDGLADPRSTVWRIIAPRNSVSPRLRFAPHFPPVAAARFRC